LWIHDITIWSEPGYCYHGSSPVILRNRFGGKKHKPKYAYIAATVSNISEFFTALYQGNPWTAKDHINSFSIVKGDVPDDGMRLPESTAPGSQGTPIVIPADNRVYWDALITYLKDKKDDEQDPDNYVAGLLLNGGVAIYYED
jgi:hypothetical protein